MPRLTITVDDEQMELIEEKSGDGGEYESKSAVVRDFIRSGERVEELEQKCERLEREKRQILEQREENQELIEYVDGEKTWREQPLSVRLRWWLWGKDGE